MNRCICNCLVPIIIVNFYVFSMYLVSRSFLSYKNRMYVIDTQSNIYFIIICGIWFYFLFILSLSKFDQESLWIYSFITDGATNIVPSCKYYSKNAHVFIFYPHIFPHCVIPMNLTIQTYYNTIQLKLLYKGMFAL